jgi:selenide,water dikinase
VDPDVGPLEDAALLRPESGPPLVFTVDFITPIVDEPEAFGAIAAANALSDVYAMGGQPQVALAVCGLPEGKLPTEVVARIFRGGRDKAAEAGCAIVGGHTVLDPELKYGLCVIGSLAPGARLTQTGARPGDRLVLTKPIGTGIAAQAIKQRRLAEADVACVVELMTTLNRDARDAALAAGARAATDVTGFGLLGHLHHLLLGCGCAARIDAGAVPLLPFARGLAEAGLVPGGSRRNLDYVTPHAEFASGLGEVERLLLADAQTSGGLLLAVPAENEARLLEELSSRGAPARAVIGEILAGEAGRLFVRE